MRLRRIALALLAGSALSTMAGLHQRAMAEDVTINLDALGPEPKKPAPKPAKPAAENAVRSDVVPDDDPAPQKAQQPKPSKPAPKPAAAKPVAAKQSAAPAEIDFIGRTKKAQGVADVAAPQAETPPAKPKTPTPPVMAAPIPDEQVQPVATASPQPATNTPPAAASAAPAAKKKPPAAHVVVDTTGLDAEPQAGGKPKGTPLTAIAPDGVLYVPKNVEALPQPVSAPQKAIPGEDEDAAKPLTLPPVMPDAPAAPVPAPAVPPNPAKPQAMALPATTPAPPNTRPLNQPPSTQTVAAVAAAKPPALGVAQDRASVLEGHATAIELKFDPGQDTLTPESQSALDQIAVPLKSTGLRVQLASYSGPPGNNSSDARRLSLKRALAVREYLAARGVPKLTVNIAAFGGAVQGATDRVDIMVRTDQAGRLNLEQ